ncbi:MAG: hypothetical protein ACYDAQ_19345 [Mycobacteriales bacterium]
MPIALYASYLRVYSPTATFSDAERARWAAQGGSGALDRPAAVGLERARALRAVVSPGALLAELRGPADEAEPALVEVVDGITYLCPLRTRVRVWESILDFREGLAPATAGLFLGEHVVRAAATRLREWRDQAAVPVIHVRCQPWSVPLAWFLLFAPADREAAGTAVRYVTPMSQARRRVAKALRLLVRTIPQAPTVATLALVGRWLEEFHPHSRVELDYGQLASLMSPQALAEDTSVADLREAMHELGHGNAVPAARAYERVLARWRPLVARATAS